MKKLDIILIDIQDTGVRYSTFISSVTKLFESASQADTEFILPKQNFAAVTQLKEDQIEEDSKK